MRVLVLMFELMVSFPVLGFEIPMSFPMLGFEVLMSFPMRFVQLSVKPTVLPLCHRTFMPRFMSISQILMLSSVFCLEIPMLFTVFCPDIPMLFTVFCIEILMLSAVFSVFVISKAERRYPQKPCRRKGKKHGLQTHIHIDLLLLSNVGQIQKSRPTV